MFNQPKMDCKDNAKHYYLKSFEQVLLECCSIWQNVSCYRFGDLGYANSFYELEMQKLHAWREPMVHFIHEKEITPEIIDNTEHSELIQYKKLDMPTSHTIHVILKE